jgi:hypothetical protein
MTHLMGKERLLALTLDVPRNRALLRKGMRLRDNVLGSPKVMRVYIVEVS